MKKFITTSPLQEYLSPFIYKAIDNEKLQMEKATSFPVTTMLNAYLREREQADLLVICHQYEFSEKNFELLKNEVKELEQEKGFQCNIVKIEAEYNECIDEHLKNFEHLIEHIDDEDELYACMTYGTKAIPIIEMMALNYAYRAKFNTHIECIAYGNVNFKEKDAKIYDMTSLFYMDEVVRKVSDMKVKKPLEVIQQFLNL